MLIASSTAKNLRSRRSRVRQSSSWLFRGAKRKQPISTSDSVKRRYGPSPAFTPEQGDRPSLSGETRRAQRLAYRIPDFRATRMRPDKPRTRKVGLAFQYLD